MTERPTCREVFDNAFILEEKEGMDLVKIPISHDFIEEASQASTSPTNGGRVLNDTLELPQNISFLQPEDETE